MPPIVRHKDLLRAIIQYRKERNCNYTFNYGDSVRDKTVLGFVPVSPVKKSVLLVMLHCRNLTHDILCTKNVSCRSGQSKVIALCEMRTAFFQHLSLISMFYAFTQNVTSQPGDFGNGFMHLVFNIRTATDAANDRDAKLDDLGMQFFDRSHIEKPQPVSSSETIG